MYTHYCYSKTHLDPDIFNRFAADVKKVLKEIGVPYTDGDKGFTFCGNDIAVTACLVLARYHFGNSVRVSSDGCSADWEQAIELVNKTFGYPMQAVDERSDGESLIQKVEHKDPVASDKEIVSVFGK